MSSSPTALDLDIVASVVRNLTVTMATVLCGRVLSERALRLLLKRVGICVSALLRSRLQTENPNTVGTKIIADPENCFQELISEKLLIFLRDGPCLELIIVSSNFQALLLLQDKLLESV